MPVPRQKRPVYEYTTKLFKSTSNQLIQCKIIKQGSARRPFLLIQTIKKSEALDEYLNVEASNFSVAYFYTKVSKLILKGRFAEPYWPVLKSLCQGPEIEVVVESEAA